MKQEKEQEYEAFVDLIEVNLRKVGFEGEYHINSDTVKNERGERFIVDISIRNDKESYLGFSYIPSKKRIDYVRATLRGSLKDRGKDFLHKLEDIAKELGCNEMRTHSDEDFWKDTDWVRYSDGTYRKCLFPQRN